MSEMMENVSHLHSGDTPRADFFEPQEDDLTQTFLLGGDSKKTGTRALTPCLRIQPASVTAMVARLRARAVAGSRARAQGPGARFRARLGASARTRYNGAQTGDFAGPGGSMQVLEGHLDAQGLRFAIVVSRFNEALTSRLESGAVDCLLRHGAEDDHITIVRVPGAWEIPMVAAKLASGGGFNAVISVGALVRGGTSHFDILAAEVAKGVAQAAISSGVPMTFGVITADTLEQAVERAGTKMGNKGWEAALAAIEMARLTERLGRRS
jgi:6,7-dimethyl-8-ribityllumazine synthase